MRRWLYAQTFVHGPVAEIERRMLWEHSVLLRRATGSTRSEPSADGSLLIRLTSPVWTLELTKQVRMRIGVVDTSDQRVVLPVAWDAAPARPVFPHFEGAFEFERMGPRSGAVTISGSYAPPLGALGAMVDSAGLHRVARHTARRLVERFGEHLGQGLRVDQPAAETRRAPTSGGFARLGRVRDVMTRDPLVLDADASLHEAAGLLFAAGITGAPVVDANGRLLGVLSEQDLLAQETPQPYGSGRRLTTQRRRRHATTVVEACSRPPRVVAPDTTVRDAARTMLAHAVSRLVVVADGRIEGVVTRHAVLAALLRADRAVEAAVSGLLAERDEPDVAATVANGTVELSGQARRRSTAEVLPREISAIGGVVSVDTRLRWRDDDLVPGATQGSADQRPPPT